MQILTRLKKKESYIKGRIYFSTVPFYGAVQKVQKIKHKLIVIKSKSTDNPT